MNDKATKIMPSATTQLLSRLAGAGQQQQQQHHHADDLAVLVSLSLLMVECLVCVANHRRSEHPFANKRNVGAYGTAARLYVSTPNAMLGAATSGRDAVVLEHDISARRGGSSHTRRRWCALVADTATDGHLCASDRLHVPTLWAVVDTSTVTPAHDRSKRKRLAAGRCRETISPFAIRGA